MLSDKITAAHRAIEACSFAKHPRLMSSFGKDSLVMTDLLSKHGVKDVLWLTDVDEVVDYPFISEVVDRYKLSVQNLSRGRAIFLVVNGQPLFLAYTFLNQQHMTPFPTNIVAWEGEGPFTCIDDELRGPRGYALPCKTDLVFTGFKLADVTAKACLTVLNLLPEVDLGDYLSGLRIQGPHFEIAPGLPACSPLLEWTDQDVWEYIHAYKVPWSRKVYDDQGKRQATGMKWCYRCHDPGDSTLVKCPKTQQMIANFAALTDETDLQLERLRRLGALDHVQVERIRHAG